jgi:hypothetical protein
MNVKKEEVRKNSQRQLRGQCVLGSWNVDGDALSE